MRLNLLYLLKNLGGILLRTISEEVRVDSAIAPTNIQAGTETGTWVSMANYRRVLAVLTSAAPAAGKDVTLQLMQATSAAGAGAKALSALVTVVSTGAAIETTVEAQASDLDLVNGFGYVTAQVTCNDAVAVQGAALLIRGDARFGTGVA